MSFRYYPRPGLSYTRSNADIALRDLILVELRRGEQWDDAVADRLAIADAA